MSLCVLPLPPLLHKAVSSRTLLCQRHLCTAQWQAYLACNTDR